MFGRVRTNDLSMANLGVTVGRARQDGAGFSLEEWLRSLDQGRGTMCQCPPGQCRGVGECTFMGVASGLPWEDD